ncbi:MAG: cell division protein ZipA [Pseudohongiellaceae bacterium]
METRELIILLLGLAVVGVILRGLYIALRSRRGHLRLAIDKNIPHDVDLDALEMTELPGGGARVVERGLSQVNRQNQRAKSGFGRNGELDLGGDAGNAGAVPVLMDSVELRDRVEKSDAAEVPGQDNNHWSNADDDRYHESDSNDDYADEDEDAVAGYKDNDFDDEDDVDDEVDFDKNDSDPPYSTEEEFVTNEDYDSDDGYDDEVEDTDEDEESVFYNEEDSNDANSDSNDNHSRREPTLGPDDEFEESLENLAITPGERIGADNNPTPVKTRQTPLFESDNDEPGFEKRAGIFERIGNKAKSSAAFTGRITGKLSERFVTANDEMDYEGDEDILMDYSSEIEQTDEPGRPSEALARSTRKSARSRRGDGLQTAENLAEKDLEERVDKKRSKPQLREIEPSEVLVINVMARERKVMRGHDLLQVLITSGLKFGDMQIFHQRMDNSNKSPIIFSVANILNPGTFDLNNMDEFSTQGVSLFMALPTPINNLVAFEQMLKAAQQIRGAMDAEMKDDHRNVMTAQTIEHYRQRIRDFELRQLKAASKK